MRLLLIGVLTVMAGGCSSILDIHEVSPQDAGMPGDGAPDAPRPIDSAGTATANPDLYMVVEDSGQTVLAVRNNDSSPPAPITSVTTPTNGVTMLSGGTPSAGTAVLYQPNANYCGSDTFTYTLMGGSTATVTMTVSCINDAPSFVLGANQTANEDAGGQDVAWVSSVSPGPANEASQTLSFTIIDNTNAALFSQAPVVSPTGRLTYAPAANASGVATLTVRVGDNGGMSNGGIDVSNPQMFSITIISVDDLPVAVNDSVFVPMSTPTTLAVRANDLDIDGGPSAVIATSTPAHGSVSLTALGDAVTYTPVTGYAGADSFTYMLNGGAAATVTLSVRPNATFCTAEPDFSGVITTSLTLGTLAGIADNGDQTCQMDTGNDLVYALQLPVTVDVLTIDTIGSTIDTVLSLREPACAATLVCDDDAVSLQSRITKTNVAPGSYPIVVDSYSTANNLPFRLNVRGTVAPGVPCTDPLFAAGVLQCTGSCSGGICTGGPVCGNGIVDAGEDCDDTILGGCTANCKLTCGSGTGASRARVDAATGRCFAGYISTMTYSQASAFCQGFGGHLPTLATATENTAAFEAGIAGTAEWLGADDLVSEGTFQWVTGEPFAFTFFHAAEPSNTNGNEDCLQFHPMQDQTWNDADCDNQAGLVVGTLCEFELFSTVATAPVAANPVGVAIADLDGDGRVDVAVANSSSNQVGILLGTGAGTFAAATNFAAGQSPEGIGTGDFNGDGRPDIVVTNLNTGQVTVVLGLGGGTFGAPISFNAGPVPRAVAVGDLNGDGALDLAVATSGTTGASLLFGTGTGTFGSASTVTTGIEPTGVALGDLDGNGSLDIVTANHGSNNVSVLLGLGAGMFAVATNYGAGSTPRSVAVADLNRDSRLDIIVANVDDLTTVNGNVSVLLGLGNGVMGPATNFPAGLQPISVAVGDFNSDTIPDLAVANLQSNNVSILLGTGLASFGAPNNFPVGTNPNTLAVGDLNADGYPDVVTANFNDNAIGVLISPR